MRNRTRLLDLLFFRFETEGTLLFALLDGARDPRVVKLLGQSGLEHECLFTGRLDPTLQAASPYIAKMVLGAPACERLIEEGWGKSWAVFVAARAGLGEVRRHFRTLLRVETEDRRKLFFRFYDPRVLRAFLPTCDAGQLQQVFGPIRRFDMEGPQSSHLVRFRLTHEPQAPATLRSWTYDLADDHELVDEGRLPGAPVEPTAGTGTPSPLPENPAPLGARQRD
jgi:hypothetical protein